MLREQPIFGPQLPEKVPVQLSFWNCFAPQNAMAVPLQAVVLHSPRYRGPTCSASLLSLNGCGFALRGEHWAVETVGSSSVAVAGAKGRKCFRWKNQPRRHCSCGGKKAGNGMDPEGMMHNGKVTRRNAAHSMLLGFLSSVLIHREVAAADTLVGFREYIDNFDGYSFFYPKGWIQVRGAGADIFFRDPNILDQNMSVEISSPSSSRYTSVEDLGPPELAAQKVLKQYLTEFMSTRLGVRRDSNILSASSKVAEDGKVYYQVEVNIKSYASNNELAVMPQDRIQKLEWDRRYLSILGVENRRLYELRLQAPENVFIDQENNLRQVMDSFRVLKATG